MDTEDASVLDDVEIDADKTLSELTFARKVPIWLKILIVAVLIVIFLVSMCLGRYNISLSDLLQTMYQHFFEPGAIVDKNSEITLFNIRFPRLVVVMLVGAGLSVAGASYQGMFKNPLVSPDLLGASAGASLGACFAILNDMPNEMIQLFAFCGGLAAVGLAVFITRFVRYDALLGLVLGGILVSTLFQSGTSLIKLVADANDKLPEITFWLMGSFADITLQDLKVIIVPMVVGYAILMLESWKLNVLSFGDEEARSMGINTRRTRLLVILASTLLTSISVAVSGIVGWVGLVIPHLARAVVGPNYRVMLPVAMAFGASFLCIVDNVCRLLMAIEIPIGILTSIIGVPFFVIIFKSQSKGWN